jgi:6-pyruvoyltetrahydropterin/6-carboxytetrahydropterin synthase
VITITKRIEFDAGHRVPDHASKCRNPHGHRYELEVEVGGEVIDEAGNPQNGMVIDFAALKQVMLDEIDARWDHAFLIYEDDAEMQFFRAASWKVDVLPFVPTAENLVRIAAMRMLVPLKAHGIELVSCRLWETRSCSAVWHA